MSRRPLPKSSDALSEDASATQSDQSVYLHFDGYDRGPAWPVRDYGGQGIFTTEQQLEISSKHGMSPELVSSLSLYIGNTLDTESMMNLNRVSRDKAVKEADVALRRAIKHTRQDVRRREKLTEVLLNCDPLFAETRAAEALLCQAHKLARNPESALTDLLDAADAVLACPGSAAILDVAAEDQVSEKTVRRAIEAGLLDVIRVGPGKRLIRIHPDAHAAYRRAIKL